MRHLLKQSMLIVALLASTSLIIADDDDNTCNTVLTCFKPRSQGRDKVLQVVGVTDYTHLFEADCWYGNFSVASEYTQSFRSKDICKCLFGPALQTPDNDCCEIRIQGCSVPNRVTNALAADNFYLPATFDSTVTFEPRIRNYLINLDLYVGLDDLFGCGDVYFRLYGPIVNTHWNLKMCETINNKGRPTGTDISYEFGVFTPGFLSPEWLLKSFEEYSSGCYAPNATKGCPVEGASSVPVVLTIDNSLVTKFHPLECSRISACPKDKTGFADLRAELGWNFLSCENYHLGLNVQGAAPTGRNNCCDFLFDAQIGNKNWELGAGLTGHYSFELCNWNIGLYLDANVTHLFKHREKRCFDLKANGPLSRYLLAAKFKPTDASTATGNLQGGGEPANFQFAGEFAPIANLTKQSVKVSASVQTDIVAWIDVKWCNWNLDAGYNFWYRSCEKISCDSKCPPTGLDGKTWGVKGVAHVFGFASAGTQGLMMNEPVPLSATSSKAKLTECAADPNISTFSNSAAEGVDSPQPATAGTGGTVVLNTYPRAGSPQVNTSIQPVLLTTDNVDLGARARGITHKVFGHVSYNFECNSCWMPYVGVGGFAEFAQRSNGCCPTDSTTSTDNSVTTDCKRCIDCGVSQWAVWVKGGVAFDL